MFHKQTKRCELVKLAFKRDGRDVLAEVTLRVLLDVQEQWALGIRDSEEFGERYEKATLRANLGWYDLDVGVTSVSPLRVRERALDKPLVEVQRPSKVSKHAELPFVGNAALVSLTFLVSVPLIGDCRDQVWRLLSALGDSIDVRFWDRDYGSAEGEQVELRRSAEVSSGDAEAGGDKVAQDDPGEPALN